MKVVFLDIDGVLAPYYTINQPKSIWWNDIAYPFEKKCVDVLNEILNKTDSEIVLTSQWRNDYTFEEMEQIFLFNNVIKTPVDKTIDLGGFTRCLEILDYIECNDIETFVIIDDIDLECFTENFVKTNPDKGLEKQHIKKIVSILSETKN